MQHRFLALLEPVQPFAFGADRADHLPGQLPLRIDAAAVGVLPDSRQVEPFDPGGGGQVDAVGERLVARFGADHAEHLALRQAEDRRQLFRRQRRLRHFRGDGEDRRRVFGGSQRVAVAVEQVAAQAGQRHRLRLLADRLGGEPRPLHALQPEGTGRDAEEAEEEAGEEEADPALGRPHRIP